MKTKKYEIIFFGIGIIAITILLYNLGWATLVENLSKVGWWFIPIIALRMVVYPMNARAWELLTFHSKKERKAVSYMKMLQLTISGYAINYITPFMALGGEPYRILALKDHIGINKATSSVITYSIMHILSHFVFWTLGCILILFYINASITVQVCSWIFIGISLIAIFFIIKGYRKGLIVSFFNFLQRIPFLRKLVAKRMTPDFENHLIEIDRQIIDLYENHRGAFFKSLFYETMSRIIGCLEILFIMRAIGFDLNFIGAIIISAETTLFANILFFSPMQLGTREGGLALALSSIGYAASNGVFIGIIMRISELFWIIIGVSLIRLTNTYSKNNMTSKQHAFIFDYGGTLDTNGIHWSNIFFAEHRKFHPEFSDNQLREAYVFAERKLSEKNEIKSTYTFKEILNKKINYQCEYLEKQNVTNGFMHVPEMVEHCYAVAFENTKKVREMLEKLQTKYSLAIVSNFYGNLHSVLDDFGLSHYFETVIESAKVGISKPDKKIFQLAIQQLGLRPESCTVIGDSYKKDIVPAKAIGCRTIWLKGKGWGENPTETPDADSIITSITDLTEEYNSI